MVDNVEFWALLSSIIGACVAEIKYLRDIHKQVADNADRINRLEKKTDAEFAKCRLHIHSCGDNKE